MWEVLGVARCQGASVRWPSRSVWEWHGSFGQDSGMVTALCVNRAGKVEVGGGRGKAGSQQSQGLEPGGASEVRDGVRDLRAEITVNRVVGKEEGTD